jgi:hypothetical protein
MNCNKFKNPENLYGFTPSGDTNNDYVPTTCPFHYGGNQLFQEASKCDFPNVKNPPTYAVGFMDAIGDLSPIGACYYNKDTNLIVQKMDTPNPVHGLVRSGTPQPGAVYDHPDITFAGTGEPQFACCAARTGWGPKYDQTTFNNNVPIGNENGNKEYGNAMAYCHKYCENNTCPPPQPEKMYSCNNGNCQHDPISGTLTEADCKTKCIKKNCFNCIYTNNKTKDGKNCTCDNMGSALDQNCNVNANWQNQQWTFDSIKDQKSCETIAGTKDVKWCSKCVPITTENFNLSTEKPWNCPNVQPANPVISGGGVTGGGIQNSSGSNPDLFNFGSNNPKDCEKWFEGDEYQINTCKDNLELVSNLGKGNSTEWVPVKCPNNLTTVTNISNSDWQNGYYPNSKLFKNSTDISKITQPDGTTVLTQDIWNDIYKNYGINSNVKLSDLPVVKGAPTKNDVCRDPTQNKPCISDWTSLQDSSNYNNAIKLQSGSAYKNDGCRNPNAMYQTEQGKYSWLQYKNTGVYAKNNGMNDPSLETTNGGVICYIGPGVNKQDGPWSQKTDKTDFATKFLPNADNTVLDSINSSNVIPFSNKLPSWEKSYNELLNGKEKLDSKEISSKYGCY